MGPGTALNLNPVFTGEWLQCRTIRGRNTNCLFETFSICITTSCISITLKTFSLWVSHFWVCDTPTSSICTGPPGTFGTLPTSFDGTVGTFSGRSLLLYAAADCDLLLRALGYHLGHCHLLSMQAAQKGQHASGQQPFKTDSRWNPYQHLNFFIKCHAFWHVASIPNAKSGDHHSLPLIPTLKWSTFSSNRSTPPIYLLYFWITDGHHL